MRRVFGVRVLLKTQGKFQGLSLVAPGVHFNINYDCSARDGKAGKFNDPRRECNSPQLLHDLFQHPGSRYGRTANVDCEKVVSVGQGYKIVEVLVLATVFRILQVVATKIGDVYCGASPGVAARAAGPFPRPSSRLRLIPRPEH